MARTKIIRNTNDEIVEISNLNDSINSGWTFIHLGVTCDLQESAREKTALVLLRDACFEELSELDGERRMRGRAYQARKLFNYLGQRIDDGQDVIPNTVLFREVGEKLKISPLAVSTQNQIYRFLGSIVERLQRSGKVAIFKIPHLYSTAQVKDSIEITETLAELAERANGPDPRFTDKELQELITEYVWVRIEQQRSNQRVGRELGDLAEQNYDVDEQRRSAAAPISRQIPKWIVDWTEKNDPEMSGDKNYYKIIGCIGFLIAFQRRYLSSMPVAYSTIRKVSGLGSIASLGRYSTAITAVGGLKGISKYIAPTIFDLVPFGILFAIGGISPLSILEIKPEDLTKIRDGVYGFPWPKDRAGGEIFSQGWIRGNETAHTLPRAFEFLRESTEWLRKRDPSLKHILMIHISLGGSKDVTTPVYTEFCMRVREFCADFWNWVKLSKKKGRFESIKSFEFTLGELRATGINIFHIDNGLNIISTSDRVSHKSMQTTEGYIQHEPVRAANRAQIRDGMEFMVDWVSNYKPSVIPANQHAVAAAMGLEPTEQNLAQAQNLIDQESGDIGHGISCTDRENSPWPLARKGQPCEFFGGCFACPRNIIIATTLNFARIYLFRRHIDMSAKNLIRMNPMRWESIYEPQLDILADALEDFPPNIIIAGKKLVEELDIPFPPLR